jgi:hypothetical protein
MPFPGIGYVVKNNGQCQWVPIELESNWGNIKLSLQASKPMN